MAALSRAIGGRIPEILEDFVDDGHFYVIQQRIFGKTLEEIFQENRPLAEDEVVGWAIQCCRLLHSIHNYKDHPVHRDISPDNLMLTPMGDIMFIDFGTLREFQRIAKGTAGLGKFGYTPPEQWKGRPVPQSDIFALGATIYFLLTGFLPHSDELKNGKSPQLSDYEPTYPPIRTKNQKVSRELERILLHALDLDISKRYLAAEQMMIDLDKLPKPKPTSKPMMPVIREPIPQTPPTDVPVVLCPKCGQPNEPHLVYCKYDEAVLYDGTQECPKCGRPVPINAKFCARDGTPMITKPRE